MPQNSLKACAFGIEKARIALNGKGWSQQELARQLEISRQPTDKFFKGELISNDIFTRICKTLELDWQEIAGISQPEEQENKAFSIDELVQTARENIRESIKERCGTMRVLDMTQPIGLGDIYTDVNILEEITGRTRREIAELLKNFEREDFDHFGISKVTQKRVPGLQAVEQHSKLMVLGKPGAGKTTFLKHLAMQCIEEQFQKERFPIFITLKDFAEAPEKPNILNYIAQQLSKCKVKDANVIAGQLLEHGKVLVLLDGLDEVREEDTKRVLNQVQEFSYQFSTNQFIITCRIAAKEYTFQGFTDVEVADFEDKQIGEFATKWFQAKDSNKAQQFIQKLQENKRVKELATNPLLLTLLCLLFGESTNFPFNRSELYQQGLDVLLRKWDGTRFIERDQVYQRLSLKRKEDLLSNIALETFKEGNFFFKESQVEGYISSYIQNLPDAKTDPEALLLDSKVVLKSIEAQHGLLVERAKGVYSFSHLTFHEFFAARNIALSHNSLQALQQLVSHITAKRWREVLGASSFGRNTFNIYVKHL